MNGHSKMARIILVVDPIDGEPVFLGVTRQDPRRWLSRLRSEALARGDSPIGDYLGHLAGEPELRVVAEVDADGAIADRTAELRAWRAEYPDLLNAVPHGAKRVRNRAG